jgi:uncharacterized protein (TIGR01777 family)
MKVLIAGATGMIGSELARALIRDGVSVSALVRDPARAATLLPGVTAHTWAGVADPPPAQAFDGVDAVVNVVGESMAARRWSTAQKQRLRDSRVGVTRALVAAMRGTGHPARVLISASGAAYYGDRGDEILTEASSSGQGFVAELARDWEAEAARASDGGSGRAAAARVVHLRSGVVLSRSGGILSKILLPFRLGLGGRLGDGNQWFPWIHLDDAIGIIRHALRDDGVSGPLNLVGPEPVTNREFTTALGEALSRPTLLAVPSFALRLTLGQMADELLLTSQRVMPVRTLESGYQFRYPLLRPALASVL